MPLGVLVVQSPVGYTDTMRVIYFSEDYTTHDWRHLDKLARTSHRVWYLRLRRGPVARETRPIPAGIGVIPWPGAGQRAQGLVRQLALLPALRRLFREMAPDLVHAGPIPSCGLLSALTGFRPLLLMSWGSDLLRDADRSPLSRWAARLALRRADAIVGDCRAVREKARDLLGSGGDRIVTYPWGVDLATFQPASGPSLLRRQLGWQDARVILSTRSWEPVYGIEALLQAFQEVVRRAPEARLLLLGDGSLAPRVRGFLRERDLERWVHLPGQIPHERLVDYFHAADLYVSSSLSDGTSISLLEAMACGLPVVVTDLAANREWVAPGVNGWLVGPGEASSLSSSLLVALGEPSRWPAMGQANLATARARADWDRNFQVLMGAYDRIEVGRSETPPIPRPHPRPFPLGWGKGRGRG